MTEEEIKKYHEKVDANIEKYGYQSTFVFGKKSPSFCYSTGAYKSFGIPEVFLSSLPKNLSHTLVVNYINRFKDGTPIPLNTRINDLTDRFPVYLIEVDPTTCATMCCQVFGSMEIIHTHMCN